MVKEIIERHLVQSESSNNKWVVVKYDDNSWACSCPKWIFHKGERINCKHIQSIINQKDNSCLNEKKSLTKEQKINLLKVVLDDVTFNLIKNNPKKIDEAFDFNLANIIIQTGGEF